MTKGSDRPQSRDDYSVHIFIIVKTRDISLKKLEQEGGIFLLRIEKKMEVKSI